MWYRLFFVLLFWSFVSGAVDEWGLFSPYGFKIGGHNFVLTVWNNGWKGSILSAKTAVADSGYPKKNGNEGEYRGIYHLPQRSFRLAVDWKRPAEEVGAIMGLLKKYLLEAISRMERDRVKMEFFGDLSPLPQELQDLCRRTREISKGYDGCQVNVCLNYGGRDELLRAARAYAQDCVEGRADPNHLTAEHFAGYLFSRGVPDPDLVIRPSGELRLSNFLLWQSAYAEFYFTDVLWPDFTKEELHRAIAAYQGRSRRFGGV